MVHYVYPTWSAQPHRGVGDAPVVSTIQEINSRVKCALTSHSVGQKMNAVDALPNNLKKKGRPKGSGKMTLSKYADNPTALILPKTEQQKIKELKDLLINSAGSNVVYKAVEIAMNDEHPAQMAALKLCMDRMLPVSLFEKEGKQRSAVNITISGIGGVTIGENPIDAEDIEAKE